MRVDLLEDEHVCSVASKRRKYRQEVKVGSQTTRSVPFIIIPIKVGLSRIEVKAAVKDSSLNDGIMKSLQVVVRKINLILSELEKHFKMQVQVLLVTYIYLNIVVIPNVLVNCCFSSLKVFW